MARNTMRLDTKGFEEIIAKLDSLGGNVQKAVEDALKQAAETIKEDTIDALDSANLPAQGRFSQGTTRESVVTDSRVTWEGTIASIPIGFDFSELGAGGYLITGTPRMKPDAALNKMYKQKKYMRQIQGDMWEVIADYVVEAMEK